MDLVKRASTRTECRASPDLIFEFVSADRADQERDYIDKRREYHAIGVREYVIVDRFQRAALVLMRQRADYAERPLSENEAYATPLLPGLVVPLREVVGTNPLGGGASKPAWPQAGR